MPIKILAVVSEPVSGDALKTAIGADRAEEAEVLVVAPALNTRARYWLSDPDSAIGRADDVQQETVERMDEQDVDAVGDTGESDPLLAVQDALQTFPADAIVLFTHPDSQVNWLEDGVVDELKKRFKGKVEHLVIEG